MKKELQISYEKLVYQELSEVEKKLFETARDSRKNAYAPYSNFLVGCAILLENGVIFSGNNQENAAYPSGLCAERTTIYWVGANYPTEKILKLFVVGGSKDAVGVMSAIPPCGSCRQSILEYEAKQKSHIEIYFSAPTGEIYKTQSIRDLLPFSFDASYLQP